MSETILVLDPFSGASGDMMVALLVDLGVPEETVRELPERVPALAEARVELREVKRGLFRATRLFLELPESHHHRGLAEIEKILEESDLPNPVCEAARQTFRALARAEAKVHGESPDSIRFHEVGALDSIFDILAWHLGYHELGSPPLRYTRICLGRGEVQSAHGRIPLPAPATLELLRGHRVVFSERTEELVTPTAAAILATLAEPLSWDAPLRPERVGYGAGSRGASPEEGRGEPGRPGGLPNVLRGVLARMEQKAPFVRVLTTTIDDMNPEVYGHLMERLFRAGALDVYMSGVTMKKNRPGVELTVVCEEGQAEEMAALLLTESTTLGVRSSRAERIELERRSEVIRTRFGEVVVKVAKIPDGGERMSPEYESCRRVAERQGVPLWEVYQATIAAWEDRRR
jgi:hypothetical protein